jgi:hypothetical protein
VHQITARRDRTVNYSKEARSSGYWARRGVACGLAKFNCSEATLQTCQDMISRREDVLLQAVSGLLGGVVCRGSSCGVVSGGALGLALMHEDELLENGLESEVGLISLVGGYAKWFERSYGTTLCRERIGVDFWSLGGVMRYILPGDRIVKCMSHMNGAMKYLYDRQYEELPKIHLGQDSREGTPVHCAQAVLEGVRANTSIGDPLLERLSVVLDGGIGLQGGACGALVGAILATNTSLGVNLREYSMIQSYMEFFSNLKYLFAGEPYGTSNSMDVGRVILAKFEEVAGSVNCSAITGIEFADWASFQDHVTSSERCRELIDLSIREATLALQQHTDIAQASLAQQKLQN